MVASDFGAVIRADPHFQIGYAAGCVDSGAAGEVLDDTAREAVVADCWAARSASKMEGQIMTDEKAMARSHLPIPSAPRTGLITYDAKDPDTTYPPIENFVRRRARPMC